MATKKRTLDLFVQKQIHLLRDRIKNSPKNSRQRSILEKTLADYLILATGRKSYRQRHKRHK
jgi:hypothetical protein